jgi:hypothetical protein
MRKLYFIQFIWPANVFQQAWIWKSYRKISWINLLIFLLNFLSCDPVLKDGVFFQKDPSFIQFKGFLKDWPEGHLKCSQWTLDQKIDCVLPVKKELLDARCPFEIEGAIQCQFESAEVFKHLFWGNFEESFFVPLDAFVKISSFWTDENFLFMETEYPFFFPSTKEDIPLLNLGQSNELFNYDQNFWELIELKSEKSESIRPHFILTPKQKNCGSFFFSQHRWGESCEEGLCFDSFNEHAVDLTLNLIEKLEMESPLLVEQLRRWSSLSQSSLEQNIHLSGLFWWLWHLVKFAAIGSNQSLDPFLSFFPETLRDNIKNLLFAYYRDSCLPLVTWHADGFEAQQDCQEVCRHEILGPFQSADWIGGLLSFEWRTEESLFLAKKAHFETDWRLDLTLWGLPSSWDVQISPD